VTSLTALWTLKQTLSGNGTNSGLDSYANLLHAFGQDLFIQATQAGGGSGGANVWYKAVSDERTRYDVLFQRAFAAKYIGEYSIRI